MHTIETENWIANITASYGGNLCRLYYKPLALEILRSPKSIADLPQEPELYGVPVLFPPNRIDQGKFIFEGRVYQFPLNEPDRNNHLHGFALGKQWDLMEPSRSHITVKFNYTATADFPHDFTLSLSYCFEQDFVKQEMSLLNRSNESMPFGLGFHTCFNCTQADKIYITTNGRWEVMPPRYLPTGKFTAYNFTLQEFSNNYAVSQHCKMTNHQFSDCKFRGAILERKDKNAKVFYELSDDFKHWCLWNDGGNSGFFCPEPMTWMINAPNMDLPNEVTGICKLPAYKKWQSWTKIYVKVL